MRKFIVTSALLLLTAPAAGQQFQFRTLYGCGIWSCHTLEYLLHPFTSDNDPNLFIEAESNFFAPGGLGGFLPLFSNRWFPEYLVGAAYFSDYGPISGFQIPRYVDLYVSYGRVGYEWPHGEVANETIRLTGTVPEPASLLLLLTGLAGIGGAARRRRRKRT